MIRLLLTSCLALVFTLLPTGAVCAEQPGRGPGRRVTTWVPPYAVGACKQRLNESFDGVGIKDGITHLGLQFWNPTKTGGVELVKRFREKINEQTVAEFRQWAHTHGIKVMLCVYNATPSGWDWELARSAFDNHRTQFIDALVKETLRLQLDGVDIDLEGKGPQDASRVPFIRFIRELSARLGAQGKELTLDTFAHKWNAPNQRWWPALLPHVDGLHVMGYSETGAGADGWRSYNFIKAAAVEHAGKLQIGMPGDVAAWQGAPVSKHLQWIANDPKVGLAIWDTQLKHPTWRTKQTWQTIAEINQTTENAEDTEAEGRSEKEEGRRQSSEGR